jgi:hypothetical protein
LPRVPAIASTVACALGLAALAPGVALARGLQPVRSWHGLRLRALEAPPARASADVPPLAGDEVLSNERTFTRSAYSIRRAPIRSRPERRAREVAHTRLYTEDGFPEIYLVLRSHVDAGGVTWVEVRIPMRPNGRTGWVRRDALGRLRLTHLLLVVDRHRMRITLRRDGHAVWHAPVGVGKRRTPTPAGRFWIRERFKILDPRSGYYPFAFGTSDYSTLSDWPGGGVVGIHGPYYAPQAIPGRISHGCIRLRVRDDAWLARHIRVGVPLRVV